MTSKIQVRVSTVYERISEKTEGGKSVKSKFFSLNVADEFTSEYLRLPEADLTSYAVTEEVWAGIVAKCKELGVTWKKSDKPDKSGNDYMTSKPQIVVLDIEINRALKDMIEPVGLGRNTIDALKIRGNTKKIQVREHRSGNILDLED